MRNVVVLPQPDGPSRQKNEPSGMVKDRILHRDEIAEGLLEIFDPDLSHGSLRKLRDDHEHRRAGEHGHE